MSYNCYQEIPTGNTSKYLRSHDHLEETDEFVCQKVIGEKVETFKKALMTYDYVV